MRHLLLIPALAIATMSTVSAADAQLLDAKVISQESARQMMQAAEAEAQRNNWTVAIAIVDAGGNLIMFSRRDGTQLASTEIAIGKARAAVGFNRTSKAVEDIILGGRVSLLSVEGIVPVEGGVPVVYEGQVIGAIGVSGVTAPQDAQIAEAGLTALRP